jgi:hypothetical protein
LRCVVDTADLKKVCQAIFWANGQFDEDTGAPSPIRIEAGSSTVTFSHMNNGHFIEFSLRSRVEDPGIVFVAFSSLRNMSNFLETSALVFTIKEKKFIIESEDGRILLNSLNMEGWTYPNKPQVYNYKCQSMLLNRISRQMVSSSGDKSKDKNLSIQFSKNSLWVEYFDTESSCLGKIFCKGSDSFIRQVNSAKFCNMMRGLTSWHTSETSFCLADGFLWFTNVVGTFMISCDSRQERLGRSHDVFKAQKETIAKVNLMRAGLVSIFDTCIASGAENDSVRMDWVNHQGQDKVRVSCRGSNGDVVRYSNSQGLIPNPVILPVRKILDFMKTYMNPVAEFEIGSEMCFINIPGQVRFGVCLKRK